MQFSYTLRTHYAALLLALVVGSLVAFPQLIAEHRMGSAYQGVHPVVSDDELYYLARAHETLDGHPTLGNPYFAEDKQNPAPQFWLPDATLASISQALFHNLHTGGIVWDFVLPAAAVLAAYAILFLLTGDTFLSVAVAAFLVLGCFFAEFNRTPNPQLFGIVLVSLYGFLRTLKEPSWRWTLLAGVTGGTLFYIYPFFWTYWVVMVIIAFALMLMFARTRLLLRHVSAAFAVALVIGTPYVLGIIKTSALPFYKETLTRTGVVATHFPSGILVVVLAGITLLLFAWCWYRRLIERTAVTLFILAASLAGAIVMNQHVITGMNFLFAGHYTMPGVFMSVFALTLCIAALMRRYLPSSGRYLRIVAAVLLVLTVVQVTPHIMRAATPQPSDAEAQRYGPALAWLDAHTHTDDVVYANRTFSPYVAAYTRDDVFFSPWAYISYMPQAEVEVRYLGAHYFDGLATSTIASEELDLYGGYYVGRYQHTLTINKVRHLLRLPPLVVERYPSDKLATLVLQETGLRQGSFARALAGYHVDYLVWDTVLDPTWRIDAVPGFREVYEKNGIKVYAASNTP